MTNKEYIEALEKLAKGGIYEDVQTTYTVSADDKVLDKKVIKTKKSIPPDLKALSMLRELEKRARIEDKIREQKEEE